MKNFLVLFSMLVFVFSCTSNKTPETNYRDQTPQWVLDAYEVKPPVTVVVPGGTPLQTVDVIKTPSETIKLEEVPGQNHQTGDFSVKSDLKVVKQLAELGNCLVMKTKLYDEIKAHKQFDYTTDTSEVVAENLATYVPVVLTTYKKSFSKTIAYRNVGSNVIYLNTAKLPSKPTKERLNTLWHERSHVAGYGHGNNSSVGKGNSVPYGTGSMVEKYFDECYAGLK